MKILLWLVLVLVVLHLLRKKSRAAPTARQRTESTNHAAAAQSAESMVQCAHCGTYVPQSESLPAVQGKAFCCDEHRALHAGA